MSPLELPARIPPHNLDAERAVLGAILLEGREVQFTGPNEAQDAGISIIYQDFSLVPELSAHENIFLGRERRGRLGARKKSCEKGADSLGGPRRFAVTICLEKIAAKRGPNQRQFLWLR